ncbi:MAG: antitoxin MazE family protein [Stellaceae bacterium]
MDLTTRASSSRERVSAHRERMRQRGLRPIQIWVPDVRSKTFATEASRQSLAVATSAYAEADQNFVDAVSDRHGDP